MKHLIALIATALFAISAIAGGISSDFEQVKHLKIVKNPVVSEGTLTYEGENLSMIYSKPEGEYFKITESTIEMKAGKKVINAKLSSNAQFKQLRDLLILSFKGDVDGIAALTKADVTKNSTAAYDEYTLTSSEAKKRGYSKIVLRYGKKSKVIEYMELHQSNGDYTTYKLKNVQTK